MSQEAPIIGIERHRIPIDGNGVTTLVGFYGCPLRCKYCLNPQSWNPEHQPRVFTTESLYDRVKIDQLYFLATGGGITFGGGEPLLYPDFIFEFRKLCGPEWNLTLETALNVPMDNLQRLAPAINDYIIDIKDMSPDIYRRYTDKDNTVVKENLQWLINQNITEHITIRIPHIPNFNTDEDIARSREELQKMGVLHFDEFHYKIQQKSKI